MKVIHAVSAAAIALAVSACSKPPAADPAAQAAPPAAVAEAAGATQAVTDHEQHVSGPAAEPAAAPEQAQLTVQQAAAPAGMTVSDFTLKDSGGKPHRLYDLADKSAVVLILQGNGCPLSRKMTPDLKTIKETFAGKNIEFLLMNSNLQDDVASIAHEAADFAFPMPVLKDEGQVIAKALKARRTTEAFLIQPKTWKVLYHGPVDDRLDFSSERAQANHHYLRDALNQALAGKPVTVEQTEPKGCLIAYG